MGSFLYITGSYTYYTRSTKNIIYGLESFVWINRRNAIEAMKTNFSTSDATSKIDGIFQWSTISKWMYSWSNKRITGSKWIDYFDWRFCCYYEKCISLIINSDCAFGSPCTDQFSPINENQIIYFIWNKPSFFVYFTKGEKDQTYSFLTYFLKLWIATSLLVHCKSSA